MRGSGATGNASASAAGVASQVLICWVLQRGTSSSLSQHYAQLACMPLIRQPSLPLFPFDTFEWHTGMHVHLKATLYEPCLQQHPSLWWGVACALLLSTAAGQGSRA